MDSPDADVVPTTSAVTVPIDGILDLHPFAPRDVPSVVAEYVDECVRLGIAEVRLIHGKGHGVQRAVVRAALQRHPRVVAVRTADESAGGWGATLATLDLAAR